MRRDVVVDPDRLLEPADGILRIVLRDIDLTHAMQGGVIAIVLPDGNLHLGLRVVVLLVGDLLLHRRSALAVGTRESGQDEGRGQGEVGAHGREWAGGNEQVRSRHEGSLIPRRRERPKPYGVNALRDSTAAGRERLVSTIGDVARAGARTFPDATTTGRSRSPRAGAGNCRTARGSPAPSRPPRAP